MIRAISRICWFCCWNSLNSCSSPIAEVPTKSGLLQLSKGCFHCEIVADLWSAPCFASLKKYKLSSKESPLEIPSSCEDNVLPLDYLDYQSDEKSISIRDRNRFRNDPRRVPELLLLDVTGTATEQICTCGFRRASSSFDSAPKITDSVILKSFERLLVTLPLISLETWEVYSWAISGSSVFCDWFFLVASGACLETAASLLFSSKLPW